MTMNNFSGVLDIIYSVLWNLFGFLRNIYILPGNYFSVFDLLLSLFLITVIFALLINSIKVNNID